MPLRPVRAALGLLVLTAATACSSASPGVGSSLDGGIAAPAAVTTTFEAAFGPVTVESGVEKTQCVIVGLKNTAGAYIRGLHADLGLGSHHMIAYRTFAQNEYTAPVKCGGFSGLAMGMHPIFIAQQAHAELVMPDEGGKPVGLEINADQKLWLEMHYINTTDKPLQVEGKLVLDTVPLTADVIPSDFAFWGTSDFAIPANGSYETPMNFQAALPDTKTFAVTTHQHHLGTRMRVWYGDSASDTAGAPVADGQNWSEPKLDVFTPPLAFPDSGDGVTSSKGFAFKCAWKNTTPMPVGFGEGFNDEMCFLWHYYYPSQGFQTCVNGQCHLLPQ